MSKEGSGGSSDERGTQHPDCFGETTTKREYEVSYDATCGIFRGLPEDLEN
jgi:hypothetical protein